MLHERDMVCIIILFGSGELINYRIMIFNNKYKIFEHLKYIIKYKISINIHLQSMKTIKVSPQKLAYFHKHNFCTFINTMMVPLHQNTWYSSKI